MSPKTRSVSTIVGWAVVQLARQLSMIRCRAWSGTSVVDDTTSPVMGSVHARPCARWWAHHCSMLVRSYVRPAIVETGSRMIAAEIGQCMSGAAAGRWAMASVFFILKKLSSVDTAF